MKIVHRLLLGLLAFLACISIWVYEPSWAEKTDVSVSSSFLPGACAEESAALLHLIPKMDSIIDNAMLFKDFISVSAGIYTKNSGIWTANAGVKDKGKQQPGNRETRYRIASISKPMTAVAIMQLVERKLIGLDASVQTYLPDFPRSSKGQITIRQLLNHTAGIPHYTSYWDGMFFTYYSNLENALKYFQNRKLEFVPGTDYEYTTFGYTVLGAIIEKVSGLSYQEYMSKNVWLPTGMINTGVEDSKMTYANKAKLYIKLGNHFIKSPNTDLSVKYPGGGIQSTAEDLLRFGKAILENTLIDSSTLELMLNVTNSPKNGAPYGYGWFVEEDKYYGRSVYHGGSQSGASSFFQIFLDKGIVTFALANNFGSDNEVFFLNKNLSRLLLDNSKNRVRINYLVDIDRKSLQKMVGRYQNNDEILTIGQKANFLTMQLAEYPVTPVYPSSEKDFFSRIFDGHLEFKKEKDKITSVIYAYKGTPKTFVKI